MKSINTKHLLNTGLLVGISSAICRDDSHLEGPETFETAWCHSRGEGWVVVKEFESCFLAHDESKCDVVDIRLFNYEMERP